MKYVAKTNARVVIKWLQQIIIQKLVAFRKSQKESPTRMRDCQATDRNCAPRTKRYA